MTTVPGLPTIAQAASLIRARALTPVDLVSQALARIEAGGATNAFITVRRDEALAEAQRAGEEVASGQDRGPLHGIPISVKDLVDVTGTPTTSGSRVPPRQPAADAPLVRALRASGAIILGKTNLHEFAFGTTSDESAFGPVRHPRDLSRSAGGSSGGSAVAVLEGMSFGAVGTDTGGSIRIPAAACGIVGLKPGFGEISCDGVVPLCTTLDHAGPMARTVGDAAMLFQAMAGTAVHEIAPAGGRLAFGVPRNYFFDRLDPAARTAFDAGVAALQGAHHQVRDCAIPYAETTADVYLHICLPEASCHHAATLDSRPGDYSPGVRLRLEMGRYVLAEDYIRALRLARVLTASVGRALDGVDALLLPGLAIPPPPVGATTVDVAGVQAPVRAMMLRLTQLFNITGHPAIVLPAGRGPEGLPRSIQLVGHRGRTARLLEIAAAVERVLR